MEIIWDRLLDRESVAARLSGGRFSKRNLVDAFLDEQKQGGAGF